MTVAVFGNDSRLLRTRGGDPPVGLAGGRGRGVCSAHAEVIPDRPATPAVDHGLLRTRGGDPPGPPQRMALTKSAPHTRR